MKSLTLFALMLVFATNCFAGTRPLKEDTAVTANGGIVVGPLQDSTGAAITAPVIANIDITAYKNDGAAVNITPAASGTSNDMVHTDDGYYSLELTATDTSTPGYLRLTFHIAGALIYHEDFEVLPANIYDSRYGSDKLQVDVQEFGGSAGTFASGRPEITIVNDGITNLKIATGAIVNDTEASGFATASVVSDMSVEISDIKTKTDFLPSVTAGAAGGLFIAGSNAATTVNFTGNITTVAGITPLSATVSGRTLDVTATGATGIDWGNIENTAADVDLGGTVISNVTLIDSIGTNGINAASIATAAIDIDAIATGAIGVSEFAANAIDGSVIALNAIGPSEIASGAIVNGTEATGFATQTSVDAVKVRTDRIPDIVAGEAGGLFIAGTNAATTGVSVTVSGTVDANVLQWAGTTVSVPSVAGVPVVDTHYMNGNSVSSEMVTAPEIADSVWDEVLSTGHAVADSAAVRLSDILVDTNTGVAIANDGITAAKIANDAITNAKIAVDAIGASEIATAAIGAAEMDADSIGASEIANDAIDATAIANDAIDATAVAPATLNASEMGADSIGASEIADNAIDSGAIAIDSIGASEIADNAIDSQSIATDAITNAEIAADAITNAEIQSGAIVYGTELTGTVNASVTQWLGTAVATPNTAGVPLVDAILIEGVDATNTLATESEVADAVWDELLSGHVVVGSTGAGLTAASSAGDPWATVLPGAYGSGTAGKIIGDNLNATMTSRASQATLDILDTVADAVKVKTDFLPSVTAGASGGVFVAGSNAATTVNFTGSITSATSVTNPVTVGTNNDKTGYALSVAPPTVASIADGVWDEALAGHLAGGSTGAALNAAGAAGDPWSTALPGAYGVGTAGKIVGDFIDAAVSSRSDQSSVNNIDTTADAIKVRTDRIPNIAAGAAGGMFIAGTNAETIVNFTGSLTTVGTVTNPVTVDVNNDKTGYSLATAPPTAGTIADAVWDEATASHLTGGSTGSSLNAAGSSGDPWATSLPGAYGAGTAGKIVGDNINATILSRATQTSVDTINTTADSVKLKTDFLPSVTAGASGGLFLSGTNAATTVNFTGNMSGSVGSVSGNLGGNVLGNVEGNVTGLVSGVKPLSATVNTRTLDVSAEGSAEIDGLHVWDVLLSSISVDSSIGKFLKGLPPTFEIKGPSVIAVPRAGTRTAKLVIRVKDPTGVVVDPVSNTINLTWASDDAVAVPSGLPATATRVSAGVYSVSISIPSTQDKQQRFTLTAAATVGSLPVTDMFAVQLVMSQPTSIIVNP